MSSSLAPAAYIYCHTNRRWMACGILNANAAKMEKLLEDGINAIGLGPQGMGGNYSVMGVNIENTARHPSAIGVAVNVGCWSHRRGHIVFERT